MAWTDDATAIVGVSAGLIAIAGAIISYGANRRAQYDRVLTETAKLTTGEVAASRHRVGLTLEQAYSSKPPREPKLSAQECSDFYSILWTFERLDALFISLKPILPRGGRFTRPERLLLISVRGAAKTWSLFAENPPQELGDISRSKLGVNDLNALAEMLTEGRPVSTGRREIAERRTAEQTAQQQAAAMEPTLNRDKPHE